MALSESLRLEISADANVAKAELQKLYNELAKLQRELKKTDDRGRLMNINKSIEVLNADISTVTGLMPKMANGSNQAANALTNLGRVAQDAPFGFIGIQNNLNPLLESFQRLKAETGSTSGALKSLAGSLIGPAGLGLALSVGSAALLMFGDRLFKTDNAAKQAAESMDKLRDSAAKELVEFKKLTVVAADANIPLVQRKQAVEDLQKNYPAYLGNLSQEDILAGKIGGAYDKVVQALRAKIALQAAEEKVIPIIKEQLKVAEDLANAQKAVSAVGGITEEDFKQAEKFAKATGKINPLKGLQAEAIAAAKKIPELQKAYNAFEIQIQRLFGTMKPFIEASNGLNQEYDKQKDKVTDLKDEVANYIKELLYLRTIEQQGMRNVSTRAVRSAEIQAPEAVGNDAMVKRTQAVIAASQAQLSYANALRLTTMNEEQAAEITNVAMSAFTSLGNAMLQGQDIGEALSNTFKRLIVDLTAMIARALIFKAIMAAITGGGSAIASSAGATVGKGMMAMFGGIRGFADGGIATGPKSGYPAILHGTEAILNPRQFKNLTSNMMNFGAMRGMGQSQPVNGQVVLRGQDLVLALDRAGVNLNLRRG
jgi:hypothetical protein